MAVEFQKALVNEASFLIDKRELHPSKNFRWAVLKNETIIEKKFF